jgi:hypothetical protein
MPSWWVVSAVVSFALALLMAGYAGHTATLSQWRWAAWFTTMTFVQVACTAYSLRQL